MQFESNPACSGVSFYDPYGHWHMFSNESAVQFANLLLEWASYARARHKPVGWLLTHTSTGEKREFKDGARLSILGDSFIILDSNNTQLGDALPATDWKFSILTAG